MRFTDMKIYVKIVNAYGQVFIEISISIQRFLHYKKSLGHIVSIDINHWIHWDKIISATLF